MIPDEKRVAVERGLRAAFGVGECEEMRRLTRGLSADLVLRVVVRGRACLLRIIQRTDVKVNPAQHFACMSAAAEVGIAPRVHYASAEDRILITDYVEAAPFPAEEARRRMPVVLRKLHSLQAFPKTVKYLEFVDGFVGRFEGAHVLPVEETAEAIRRYREVAAVYPRRDEEHVSSHNDLKPENFLFDGRQVWIVDWEAAFLNDRYCDPAVVANFVVRTDGEERDYLREYLGAEPSEYQRARFFLMRQIVHMAYAAVFLMFGSRGKVVDAGEVVEEFDAFHRRVWEGAVNLAEDAMKVRYGRAHLARLVENARAARWEEAMRVVSEV